MIQDWKEEPEVTPTFASIRRQSDETTNLFTEHARCLFVEASEDALLQTCSSTVVFSHH